VVAHPVGAPVGAYQRRSRMRVALAVRRPKDEPLPTVTDTMGDAALIPGRGLHLKPSPQLPVATVALRPPRVVPLVTLDGAPALHLGAYTTLGRLSHAARADVGGRRWTGTFLILVRYPVNRRVAALAALAALAVKLGEANEHGDRPVPVLQAAVVLGAQPVVDPGRPGGRGDGRGGPSPRTPLPPPLGAGGWVVRGPCGRVEVSRRRVVQPRLLRADAVPPREQGLGWLPPGTDGPVRLRRAPLRRERDRLGEEGAASWASPPAAPSAHR
jgi:hypothetical protein